MNQLSAIYLSELFGKAPTKPHDGITLGGLGALLDGLVDKRVRTPGVASMLSAEILPGALEQAILLVLGDCRLEAVAAWASALHSHGFSSLAACSLAQWDAAGFLSRRDAPILLGHGVVAASRGVTGRALVGLGLAELRRELEDSRRRLSAAVGYSVNILAPAAPILGRAVDGLVLEEAYRAGYRLIVEPGAGVTNLSDLLVDSGRAQRLSFRVVSTDDPVEHLVDWVLGTGLTRQAARISRWMHRPRRILSRLDPR